MISPNVQPSQIFHSSWEEEVDVHPVGSGVVWVVVVVVCTAEVVPTAVVPGVSEVIVGVSSRIFYCTLQITMHATSFHSKADMSLEAIKFVPSNCSASGNIGGFKDALAIL